MADFSSSGIWDRNTGRMVDYDEISIDKELINEFEQWIDYYDECFCEDFSTFKQNKSGKLNKWGKELAKKLKNKMINCEIVYVGEDESGILEPEIINGV